MKKLVIKSSFLGFATLLVTISSSFPVSAMEPLVKTDQYFKDANIQIMTVECDETTPNSAVSTLTGTPTASTTTSGGGGCGEKTDDSKVNKDQVWSFFNNKFTEAGYSKEAAENATSGIMGNWKRESGFNPDKHNSSSKGAGCTGASGPVTGTVGLGIAQWCGSRQQDLADFAVEKGTEISCLGTQLEFTWMEMEKRNLPAGMKDVSASEAASIFNLGGNGAQGFEIGADNGIRMGHADELYAEYTGKSPGALGNVPKGANEATGCAEQSNATQNSGAAGNAPTSSGECNAEKERFYKLVAAGKIDISNREAEIREDVDKCTTSDIACGGGGGVKPRTIGVINDLAENVGKVYLWNFNNGHPDNHGGEDGNGCNRNHPHGKAADISCGSGAVTSMETCQDFIDYLIENKEKIGYSELIWQQQYRCDSGVNCTVGGHADHIHLGGREW